MGPMTINTIIDTLQQLNQYVQTATTIDDVVAVLSGTLGVLLAVALRWVQKNRSSAFEVAGVAAIIAAGVSVVIVGQLYGLHLGLMQTFNGAMSVLGAQKAAEILHGGATVGATAVGQYRANRSGGTTSTDSDSDNT